MLKKQNNTLVYEIIGTIIGNVIYGFTVTTGVILAFKLFF